MFLAFALMELGRFEEAKVNLVKAKQLDPLSGIMRGGWISYYRYSRDAEKLLEFMQVPNQVREGGLEFGKRWYYFLKEEYDSVLVNGNSLHDPILLGIAYAKTGKVTQARKIVDSLQSISPYNHAFSIGIIYAWLDEKQKAMEYLNLAYRLYDYNLISIKVNKVFDPLRNEASFKELLRKMGME